MWKMIPSPATNNSPTLPGRWECTPCDWTVCPTLPAVHPRKETGPSHKFNIHPAWTLIRKGQVTDKSKSPQPRNEIKIGRADNMNTSYIKNAIKIGISNTYFILHKLHNI